MNPGTYWLTLQDASSPTGSVDAFWLESDGPSSAYLDGLELTPANYHVNQICETPGANGDCSQSFAINGVPTGGPAPSPVPAPSTLSMLGFGLAGLAFMRRRKSV